MTVQVVFQGLCLLDPGRTTGGIIAESMPKQHFWSRLTSPSKSTTVLRSRSEEGHLRICFGSEPYERVETDLDRIESVGTGA